MNYYEHHIGDYAEATAHLSFVEDAAYSRLIRKYYSTEKPLPHDVKAVQRLIGARSKEERAAVQAMLDEFFTLKDDGWHQLRCDEEIARLYEKSDKARASARARWDARNSHSEQDANAYRTHTERICEPDATSMRQQDESQCERNALQSPVSSPQSPEEPEGAPRRRRPSRRAPEDFEPDREYALREVPDLDVDREIQKFRDCTFKTARSDWPATWRTWVATCRDGGKYARADRLNGALPDSESTPAVLPNGDPNPIVVISGRRVRQFILGPDGQVGTNPEAVRW